MFHKAKTEAERQKIFDDYFLTLLKKKEVIKKNKKIIDEQEFTFDPTMDENKVKGAFNSYVDSLVVKNFLIEQIYSRLKISKSMALNFVNKLDGNQILILSKVVNEFIKDIQDKYVNNNDYILKTSFDELQTNYNVIQLQEKNEDIIKQKTRTGIETHTLQQEHTHTATRTHCSRNTPAPAALPAHFQPVSAALSPSLALHASHLPEPAPQSLPGSVPLPAPFRPAPHQSQCMVLCVCVCMYLCVCIFVYV